MKKHFSIILGGMPIDVLPRFSETENCFGSYISEQRSICEPVSVTQDAVDFWLKSNKTLDGVAEFSMLSLFCSDRLLLCNKCLFHAVALTYNHKAYLITAPPGVGKTTQLLTLRTLYPGEFDVISGDRPVLEMQSEQNFLVHPSPWNGKEQLFGASSAPLAGIICLERGSQSELTSLSPKQAVLSVLPAIMCSRLTEDLVQRMASFEDKLLSAIPVWKLTSFGIQDSARLLYQKVFSVEVNCI